MVMLLFLFFLLPIVSTLLPKWQQARNAELFWLPPSGFSASTKRYWDRPTVCSTP